MKTVALTGDQHTDLESTSRIKFIGFVESKVLGSMVPLFDITMMSDERQHELAAEQRRKHPEIYEKYERGELFQ